MDSKILLERLDEQGKINHLFNLFNLAPSKLNTAKLSSDPSFNWLIFLQLNIEFTYTNLVTHSNIKNLPKYKP